MKTFQEFGQRLRLNQKAAIFLLCFLLSMVFWIFTSLSKDYETHITIPVNYRNMPFTKYFDGDLPATVDLFFRGTGFKLAGVHLRDRPDSILVDVSAFSKNKNQLNFQTIALKNQFPGELKPFKVTPEVIHAGLNSRLSKKVPVKLVSQVTFRQRFEPREMIRLEPESVEIAFCIQS